MSSAVSAPPPGELHQEPAQTPAGKGQQNRALGLTSATGLVIGTGVSEPEQWDDGNNTLALAPGVVVAYERNIETNSRLADSGIEVLSIAASELGTGRGGPRCMSCPAARDPL